MKKLIVTIEVSNIENEADFCTANALQSIGLDVRDMLGNYFFTGDTKIKCEIIDEKEKL